MYKKESAEPGYHAGFLAPLQKRFLLVQSELKKYRMECGREA
jgi:hypothetical protein